MLFPSSFSFWRSPLVRQIAGAVGGAVAALALYGVFTVTYPAVRAMLPDMPVSAEDSPRYSDADRQAKQERIVEEARQKAEKLVGQSQE